jgi:hypothetical protein
LERQLSDFHTRMERSGNADKSGKVGTVKSPGRASISARWLTGKWVINLYRLNENATAA